MKQLNLKTVYPTTQVRYRGYMNVITLPLTMVPKISMNFILKLYIKANK
jgi:hypothetical protein